MEMGRETMKSNTDHDLGKKRVIIRSPWHDNPIDYITNIEVPKFQSKFTERLAISSINTEVTRKLARLFFQHDLKLVVFSAAWCKDCQIVIPVLAKLYQMTKIPMKILGDVKVNQSGMPQWHVPPSPPEINELAVVKVPAIIILDDNNNELARIYEQPPEGYTLEQHMFKLLTGILEQGES
ncbi:hypothetical protein GF325_17130 [Candidatus Bathyarchaeota archaeon]|nr:hypothetical protein [Candidatus Bathyarchaeota archaeon]